MISKFNKNKITNDNIYLKINKNNGQLECGFYSYGYGANSIGGDYIRLDHVLEQCERLLKVKNETEQEQDLLMDKWQNDKSHTDYYNKEYAKLETRIDNLYNSYYYNVHAILTNEEINQIQKEINYNFFTYDFNARMITLLKNKEVNI